MDKDFIRLYHKNNIHTLVWPDSEEGQYAKRFLLPFIQNGTEYYVDNIKTTLMVLKCGEIILPITVNGTEYENSYVCSIYGHYVAYPSEIVEKMPKSPMKFLLKGLLHGVKKGFQNGDINRTVLVNNWFFSTNPYPKMRLEQIKSITEFLIGKFPDHAIIFRTLNSELEWDLIHFLEINQYDLIASRQVYIWDPQNPKAITSRMFKSDKKIYESTSYEIGRLAEGKQEEYNRISELYNCLYCQKYSKINPQWKPSFFELAHKNNLLTFKTFKKEGKIDAVLGYFSRNGVITAPIFGYDLALPQEFGLYRLISTELALDAKASNQILNQSSGASSFKKLRRAEPNMEYFGVFRNHLPRSRQIPWIVLKQIANKIGIQVMQTLEI